MKTRIMLCSIVLLVSGFTGSIFAGTEGPPNVYYGYGAGVSNTTGSDNTFIGVGAGNLNTAGSDNTFLGAYAGVVNTTGLRNTFVGWGAGNSNSIGYDNTYVGAYTGVLNTTGVFNTFLGTAAGYSNTTGTGNVFIGDGAGYSETGSNKLYIDNCFNDIPCTPPLIYGEFDTRSVRINGAGIGVAGYPPYTLDVSNMGVSRSSLHFSLNGTDAGGWVTSVTDNNFWLSSGAMYDASAGGWVQKSPDGLAVMAGSGPAGYRVITRSGCAVGSVCPPTTRLTVDYSGNVGFGITPAHPLHLAGGAYSDGVNWINGSSRDYKDNIKDLTTEKALSAFQGLTPVTFTYKAGGEEQHIGFIAEDVPDLVATKDRKGLNPMDIVAVLTKVVQEQQKTNQEQQTVIKSLIEKLAELEAKMEGFQTRGNSLSIISQK